MSATLPLPKTPSKGKDPFRPRERRRLRRRRLQLAWLDLGAVVQRGVNCCSDRTLVVHQAEARARPSLDLVRIGLARRERLDGSEEGRALADDTGRRGRRKTRRGSRGLGPSSRRRKKREENRFRLRARKFRSPAFVRPSFIPVPSNPPPPPPLANRGTSHGKLQRGPPPVVPAGASWYYELHWLKMGKEKRPWHRLVVPRLTSDMVDYGLCNPTPGHPPEDTVRSG